MKYYIVGNRAFKKQTEAIQYCNKNDFDSDLIVEAVTSKKKYYELQTTVNNQIYHNRFLTSEELEDEYTKKYIEELKNGEYYSRFVHLKEITEKQYKKYIAWKKDNRSKM